MKDCKVKNQFRLSKAFCLHNGAVVIEEKNNTVTIGLLNPENDELKIRLSKAVEGMSSGSEKSRVEFVLIDKSQFNNYLEPLFKKKKSTEIKEDEKNEAERIEENEVAVLLESLILKALTLGATDIHIEDSGVRFRIGGKLVHEIELDGNSKSALIQRIKLLAKLNVLEKRRGQDGRFTFTGSDNRKVFIRVSCMPSISIFEGGESESLVLRLLDTKKIGLKLENLGYGKKELEEIKKLCAFENGLVLVCGPTGSGKSTSAGAILERIRILSSDTKKIISLEDPVEYFLPGVTQIQINAVHGMDFTEALRRVFRQDPDVIMIGEIRDALTAEIAVQAAMTGHLVVATMHTGSIEQTLMRLYNLGAEKFLVDSVIRGIICQRLCEGKLFAKTRVYKWESGLTKEEKYA